MRKWGRGGLHAPFAPLPAWRFMQAVRRAASGPPSIGAIAALIAISAAREPRPAEERKVGGGRSRGGGARQPGGPGARSGLPSRSRPPQGRAVPPCDACLSERRSPAPRPLLQQPTTPPGAQVSVLRGCKPARDRPPAQPARARPLGPPPGPAPSPRPVHRLRRRLRPPPARPHPASEQFAAAAHPLRRPTAADLAAAGASERFSSRRRGSAPP